MILRSTEPEKTTSSANIISFWLIFFNRLDISFICLFTELESFGFSRDTNSFCPSSLVQSRNIISSLFISRYILSRDTMGISP
jgi:hypothetical protein